MSKQLALGNGNVLVCLNKYGQVSDFYYPEIDAGNHIDVNFPHKIGVWVEGDFSWLNDESWVFDADYQTDALASKIRAMNKKLAIELDFLDLVYNEKDVFIRKIAVKNLSKKKRTVKIFFNQQFQIYENRYGNTAYYAPAENAIVHYKGKRTFLVTGRVGGKSFDDYSIGLFNTEGKEGTWKDAEDGLLSKNTIEHGSVDSTVCFTKTPDAEGTFHVTYWIVAGKTLKDVRVLNEHVLDKKPDVIIETTLKFWNDWIDRAKVKFDGLDKDIEELFKKSLFIIRSHCDNRGAIIASGDSDILHQGHDTYSYVWMRDAAFSAMALDKSGYSDITRRFFDFCSKVLDENGYFFQKYSADGSLGSSWHSWFKDGKEILPIQEDETALVLCALWEHYKRSKDTAFLKGIYESLVKRSADFLFEFREKKTKLPKPSYDLWERLFGVSTFTVATVSAALYSASQLASALDEKKDHDKYFQASEEIREAIMKYLYNEDTGVFYKLIDFSSGKIVHDNTVDASSVFGIFNFNILDIDDPRLERAVKITERYLSSGMPVGGVGRFENDNYWRSDKSLSGNPWFITTLWLARYHIKKAKKEEDLKTGYNWLKWTVKYALNSGILSEQIDSLTGRQVSVGPLTWSHAEFVLTVIEYLERLKKLKSPTVYKLKVQEL